MSAHTSGMPWSYAIHQELDAVIVTSEGVLADNDIHEGHARLYSDPSFHPAMRILNDLAGITELRVTAIGLDAVAANTLANQTGKQAFLVASGLVAGTMNFLISSAPNQKARVFFDRAQALAWLNEELLPDKFLK